MKILFVSTEAYLPEFYGGVETSLDALVTALLRRGVDVRLHVGVAYRKPHRWRWILDSLWRRLTGPTRAPLAFGFNGYAVSRSMLPALTLADQVKKYRPDFVILLGGDRGALASALSNTGVPLIAYIHDIGLLGQSSKFDAFKEARLMTNSKFTAAYVSQVAGRSSFVLPPSLFWKDYMVENGRHDAVLFVNPKPEKGLETVLAIARALDTVPFIIVEGWTLSYTEKTKLKHAINSLKNVDLLPNQGDMREVYKRAKIMLVPSGTVASAPSTETWGRVVTEAQASGIPAIATNAGGLPEAVGDGGILIDVSAPEEVWVKAVKDLWFSDAVWQKLSEKALKHARSDLLDPNKHAEKLVSFLVSDQSPEHDTSGE